MELREEFEKRLEILNEDAGRGRAIGGFRSLRDEFERIIKNLNFDILNRSTPYLNPFKEENYNFNNYYSLDIRVKGDKLVSSWERGKNIYQTIFDEIYKSSNLADNIKNKMKFEYDKWVDNKLKKDPKFQPDPQLSDSNYWESQDVYAMIRANKELSALYEEIPVISIFSPNGKEVLAIKNSPDKNEFVRMIMDAMTSAVRGHIPQGVTIEELIEGKFSRKPIAPEQGTFINRVKDPTSDKDFDFRSWKQDTLLLLHKIIMDTFKRDSRLKMENLPELNQIGVLGLTRSGLFLYLKQEDFHALEKGGAGLSKLAKGIVNTISKVAETPNF